MSRLLRFVLPPTVALAALSAGCNSLATSPSWVGGGLAVAAPERIAAEEAQAERERRIIASQPQQIGARHILIMHDDSASKPPGLKRTRAQALQRAKEVLLKVRSGESFEELVKAYSDEPGAAERAGDLGVFDRATMVKPFTDAAFALKVGEVSEIVETKFGFHIIKRTE
jgi:parvulin-like peptidyl-prolyl isomerase